MAPVVAVAGGTGGLGRTIVEAIIETKKFEVVILARQADAQKEKDIGARIIKVDYTQVDELKSSLEENNVGTLISTLSGRAGSESELNLIAAADQAAPTKRYIPSIWGFKPSEEVAEKFPPAKDKLTFLAALSKTSLEYTAWYPGYFLDYFVFPGVRSNMNIFRLVLDVEHNVAAIPGSGNVPVIFTHTLDIAKFVAASLSFPKWSNETYVVGDRLTFNEALAIAEEVKGTKFKVTYDSVELLRSGKVTELPSHAQMYPFFPEEQLQGFLAIVGLLFENGECDFPTDQTINHDVPEIKAGTFRELMVEAWKGK